MAVAKPHRLLLIAPNVSRNMGGEAFKALMIALEWRARGAEVRQITHARVRIELERDYPQLDMVYVEDGWLQILFHRLRLTPALLLLNAWQLNRAARHEARDFAPDVVHFTSPISPVLPYFAVPGYPVVIGPLNGNVSHPPSFAHREPWSKRLGKLSLWPAQKLLGALFPAKRAAQLLVSGGERTAEALALAGCSRDRMTFTADSGVPPELAERPAIEHVGENFAFVFLGRLVRYKAADIAIRALQHSDPRCTLDIIGRGPEETNLRGLVDQLGLSERVRFLGWVPPGEALYDRLSGYRGLLLPSLAEANGIVFQEAMMLGLPIAALRWAGPEQLLDGLDSMLIEPPDEDRVVLELGAAITRLATEPDLAQHLADVGRDRADRAFRWDVLLDQWETAYAAAVRSGRERPAASPQQL
jgi:glycosyltransferase involved in cell wall biosynthesis